MLLFGQVMLMPDGWLTGLEVCGYHGLELCFAFTCMLVRLFSYNLLEF
jgi:hypothetical protein